MKNLMLALALCSTSYAFAGTTQADPQLMGLNFSDMKAACQTPARFHNQIAPTNIQLSCKNLVTRWVQDDSGSYTMPSTRQVTASLISDKYNVAPVTAPVQSAPQTSACPQFKQVQDTVETVRAISCTDVIAYEGSAIDFCATTVDALVGANQNAVKSQDTGKKISLCGSSPAQSAPVDLSGRAQGGAVDQIADQQPQ